VAAPKPGGAAAGSLGFCVTLKAFCCFPVLKRGAGRATLAPGGRRPAWLWWLSAAGIAQALFQRAGVP